MDYWITETFSYPLSIKGTGSKTEALERDELFDLEFPIWKNPSSLPVSKHNGARMLKDLPRKKTELLARKQLAWLEQNSAEKKLAWSRDLTSCLLNNPAF